MAFYILLLLTIAWFAFSFFLSHQDGEHTAETSGRLARILNGDEATLRKAAHVIVYFILMVLVFATAVAGGIDFRFGLGFVALWALLDEVTKRNVPGRHFSWFDVMLNLCGVIIGFVFMRCLV